jgi:hypothetical protein
MRLILVEHGGERVCGDSAVFGARSPEWAENAFQRVGVPRLAVVAARLCDESQGRFHWNYEYSTFGPFEPGSGYDVFVCAEDMDDAPPGQFRRMSDLLCCSFYGGFVRCVKPAIAFDLNRRRASAARREEALDNSTSDQRANSR